MRRLFSLAGSGVGPAAESVIGVVSVRPRIWGVVNGPNGPLTIVGILENKIPKALADSLTRLPDPGQVIIGFGVSTGHLPTP